MAFFNLTHLGYRNAIYEHVKDPVDTPHHIYHSGLYRTPEQIRLPPINRKEGLPEASLLPTDQTSGFGPGPAGSHEEYMRQRTKHIRNPAGTFPINYCRIYTVVYLYRPHIGFRNAKRGWPKREA